MTVPENPPRWLEGIARRLVRGANAEFVLADLAYDYARSRRSVGRVRAGLRYARLALASAWFLRDRPTPAGWLRSLGGDGRFALRMMRKSPGFTAVAILTLALGIGASGAIFSVFHGVLLAPLPYPEPDRLVNVWQVFREWQASDIQTFRDRASRFPISWPVYGEWERRTRSFEALTVYQTSAALVDGPETAEWVRVANTTRSFPDVLGVQPTLGRWFDEKEDRVGGDRVVVVSHGYWQRRLGGSPEVLGTTLRLYGSPFTVIGVMPEGFYFPGPSFDLWAPIPDRNRNDRFNSQSMSAIGRLADGVTLEAARAEMSEVADRIIEDIPDAIDAGVRLVPRIDEVAGTTAETLRLLGVAVGMVLLVAAANVAGLLLVRNTGRRRELAVRSALGARRSRLLVQLLVEGFLLAGVGGLAALASVTATFGWLRSLLPGGTPRVAELGVTWQVAAFVAILSVVVGAGFGVVSWAALRDRDPVHGLRSGSRLLAGSRSRALLVVAEIAASVVLLAGATLLGVSYYRLVTTEPGIRADQLLTLRVSAPIDDWQDPDALRRFLAGSIETLDGVPGVIGASATSNLPFSGSRSSGGFGLIAEPENEADAGWSLEQDVTASYFDVVGIPILQGRALRPVESGPPEMVISRALAEQYFADRNPVGERIWEGDTGMHTIVGIAADARHGDLVEKIEAKRYRLLDRSPDAVASFVLRVAGDPEPVIRAARDALTVAAPGATVDRAATMTELIGRTTALPRFRTLLLVTLAAISTLLAAVGLYGVVAHVAAARRREFGLRISLGAAAPQIARLVLWDGLRLTLPGVGIGLAGALATSGWLGSYLYRVDPHDPLLLGSVAVGVAILALTAMTLPARRALRVDPAIALRED